MENVYLEKAEGMQRLSRDLAKNATKMSKDEVRFMVSYYYIVQNDRIRFNNQFTALEKDGEPNTVIAWMKEQSEVLEKQIVRALDKWTLEHPVGQWVRKQHGFGSVLTAGFLSHIDIERAPSAGHIWSYAGLVPGVKWEKGQKRPWNAELKRLVFVAGDVALKLAGSPKSYYGALLNERRKKEMYMNFDGSNTQKAIADQSRYDKTTESYAWVMGCYKKEDIQKLYEADQSLAAVSIKKYKGEEDSGDPMLPPAHIVARARRYAMKMFLSHLHEVWYEHHFQKRAPTPFIIEHGGHVHYEAPPHYVSPYR